MDIYLYLILSIIFLALLALEVKKNRNLGKYWQTFLFLLFLIQSTISVYYIYNYYSLRDENIYLEVKTKWWEDGLKEYISDTYNNHQDEEDEECDFKNLDTFSFPDNIRKDLEKWEVDETNT